MEIEYAAPLGLFVVWGGGYNDVAPELKNGSSGPRWKSHCWSVSVLPVKRLPDPHPPANTGRKPASAKMRATSTRLSP